MSIISATASNVYLDGQVTGLVNQVTNQGPIGPSGDQERSGLSFRNPEVPVRGSGDFNGGQFSGGQFSGGQFSGGQFSGHRDGNNGQFSGGQFGGGQFSGGQFSGNQNFPSGAGVNYPYRSPPAPAAWNPWNQGYGIPYPQPGFAGGFPMAPAAPAPAAAGSQEQSDKAASYDKMLAFLESKNSRKRKVHVHTDTGVSESKKSRVEKAMKDFDTSSDERESGSELEDDDPIIRERFDSEADSDIEATWDETPVDFKAKLDFVSKALPDKVKVKQFIPESKRGSFMSIDSEDLQPARARKEKAQLCCPAKYNVAFDEFHAKRRGDRIEHLDIPPRPSMKEGLFPKWPRFSEHSYRLADAKLATEPPQLNEAVLGNKSSRDSSVRGSGSNVLKYEPKSYEVHRREFGIWEGASRKMVHALGFADILNSTVNKVLVDAPSVENGEVTSRVLSSSDHEMLIGILRSNRIAVCQTLSTMQHFALTLTALRREQTVKVMNGSIQDARIEQLRLSEEESGYLFPREAVETTVNDLKEVDRFGSSTGGAGRFVGRSSTSSSTPSGQQKKKSGGNNSNFRGNTGGGNQKKDQNKSYSSSKPSYSSQKGGKGGKGGYSKQKSGRGGKQ